MTSKGRPFYSDDRQIEMTAYMGPRRAGKRFFNEKYGNPRDSKDGYPEFWTDQVFQDYKDAGFTFLIPEGDAFFGTRLTSEGYADEAEFEKSDLYRFAKIAKKHNLKVYPSSRNILEGIKKGSKEFTEQDKEELKQFIETIRKYFPETYKGILLTDEPSIEFANRIEGAMAYFKECAPELDVFVSMLPIYGLVECFHPEYSKEKYEGIPITFEMRQQAYPYYMETYGKIIGEFAFDYYPIMEHEKDKLASTFYRNLEMAAESGKENGFPIAITLQAFRMDKGYQPKNGKGDVIFRVPSYEDIRYQVYSSLAFGVRRIGYFTFWQHYNEGSGEVFPTSMVVYDEAEECGYRKTAIYDAVKKVNDQIRMFDHVFLRFNWKGCRVIRKSDDENMRYITGGYEEGMLNEVFSTRDTLVGCFENPEDGREGYWIVNAQNPYFYEWNEVSVRFENASHIQYYRAGKEYNVELEKDGTFSIRLGAGEGIFVIPYTE